MYGAARHRGQVLTVQVLPSMLTELQESVSDVHLVNRAAAEYQSAARCLEILYVIPDMWGFIPAVE